MTGWGRTERAYEWLKPIAVVDAAMLIHTVGFMIFLSDMSWSE